MSEGYAGLPAYYAQSSDPITPNLNLSLKGMDPIVAENFVLIDDFAAGGGGGTPGGTNGELQYNNNGVFGGASFVYSAANNQISGVVGGVGIYLGDLLPSDPGVIVGFQAGEPFAGGAGAGVFNSSFGAGVVVSDGSENSANLETEGGFAALNIGNSTNHSTTTLMMGSLILAGATSGEAAIQVAATAGTPNPLQLPLTTGTAGQVITTDGNNPQQLSWGTPTGFSNPMTTLGDMIYENATPAPARLAGNTSTTKNFLVQTGTGSASAAPVWGTIALSDLPTGYPWSSLGNPTGNLSLSMGTDTTTFTQTSNIPWLWINSTVATISTQNQSPLIQLQHNAWDASGVSDTETWSIYSTPYAAGLNKASTLTMSHSGSTTSSPGAFLAIPSLILAGGYIDCGAVATSVINFSTGAGLNLYGKLYVGSNFGLEATQAGATAFLLTNFTSQAGTCIAVGNVSGFTAASGTIIGLDVGTVGSPADGFNFTPGATSSASFVGAQITPTINATSGASGSVTILKVNPTLTAVPSGTISLLDLQVGGTSKFTVDQHGHINNCTVDAKGSVSSAPTGIVASTVVVAVGAATATFTVTSTEGFTVGDTVTLSASGWTAGSGLASSTATVTTVPSTTSMVLTRVSGGPWVAGTYSSQTGTLTQTGGTSVSVVYAFAYANTPTVVVTPTSNAGAFYLSASSTTGFTITYSNSGTQTFNYMVMGNPN
jgi:hypothetical protein